MKALSLGLVISLLGAGGVQAQEWVLAESDNVAASFFDQSRIHSAGDLRLVPILVVYATPQRHEEQSYDYSIGSLHLNCLDFKERAGRVTYYNLAGGVAVHAVPAETLWREPVVPGRGSIGLQRVCRNQPVPRASTFAVDEERLAHRLRRGWPWPSPRRE